MNKFELARKKYKPDRIKYLLLAEAPPRVDSKRFFYFENIKTGDTLYLETMKALFPNDCLIDGEFNTKKLRDQKTQFLLKFKEAGYYLDDASKEPMPDHHPPSVKTRILKQELPLLLSRLRKIIDKETPVILISSPVFSVCRIPLAKEGFKILNDTSVPFPAGYQLQYREGLLKCLKKVCPPAKNKKRKQR